jgi:TRAP-type C4-dicarboxylate transport system substrate-binding protein
MAKTMLINVATNYPEPDVRSDAYRYWAKLVNERSQGRIKLQIHYGGSLLPLPEIFNGLSQGITQSGTLVASYMSGRVPDFTPFEIFYSYDSDKWKPLDDEAKPLLDKILQKQNVKYLGGHYIGSVTVTSPDKFIKTIEDWGGLKVRTAGRWQAGAIQAWGGKPVSIPLGEMYTSLQTGVVDAGLLVYSLIDSFRIYEVAPYVTHLGSVPQWSATGMNLKFWNSLSGEDQKIIQESAIEMENYLDRRSKELEPMLVEKLKGKGAKIYRPSAEEIAKMREKVEPLWSKAAGIVGPDGKQLMAILEKYQ